MSTTVTKEQDVELSSGRTVSVDIEIFGIYDSQFGADADGNRGQGRWLIDSHGYTITEDDLTPEEETELDEKVEEIVYDGEWDFDNAEPDDEDDDHADYF